MSAPFTSTGASFWIQWPASRRRVTWTRGATRSSPSSSPTVNAGSRSPQRIDTGQTTSFRRGASDAVSALVNLGYAPTQASAAVAAAMREAGDGAEAARLIRLGLKELAR